MWRWACCFQKPARRSGAWPPACQTRRWARHSRWGLEGASDDLKTTPTARIGLHSTCSFPVLLFEACRHQPRPGGVTLRVLLCLLAQARLRVQDICDRMIREAKQRMQSEAAGSDDTPADAAAPMNGESKSAADGERPRRKRMGALPPGGFISHMLSSDNISSRASSLTSRCAGSCAGVSLLVNGHSFQTGWKTRFLSMPGRLPIVSPVIWISEAAATAASVQLLPMRI